MKHVTNGESAAELFKLSGIGDEILTWDDVLHDGPVPGGLDAEALAKVRAEFISGRGWGAMDDVLAKMRRRDETLQRYAEEDDIVLWFEHDLYDQLQLLQILDRLAQLGKHDGVYLAQSHTYLGESGPEHFRKLLTEKVPVHSEMSALARRAWKEFTSPEHCGFADLRNEDTSCLPYLRSTVQRLLEEYPWQEIGLTRTQQSILSILADGPCSLGHLFRDYHHAEEYRFMGDWSFSIILQELGSGDESLLHVGGRGNFDVPPGQGSAREFYASEAEITPAGTAVLNKERNWSEMRSLDFHMGGVHICTKAPWRYCPDTKNICSAS